MDNLLTELKTVVWGPSGKNGLVGTSVYQREQIKDLYDQNAQLRQHIDEKFAGLYKGVAVLIITIIMGSGGIIATLISTQ